MKKTSIKEIQEQLKQSVKPSFLDELQHDPRKGVQQALASYHKRMEAEKALHNQFVEMNAYEDDLKKRGYCFIAGIDEVGRGPLAGPVIAASVILPEDFYLPGLTDSKKLSKEKREQYSRTILDKAYAVGVGIATAEEIDSLNIYESTKIAMQRAILNMEKEADYLLLDAMNLPIDIGQTSLIKGDSKSVSIAAASVVAKVKRDTYMTELALMHPEYGFDKHMGYGTKEHLKALEGSGVTEEHRKSFAPIKDMI
ncbi:ribonuclease HII [Alteribacter aurantiacus]|uniref:ribonuclease HII n=1 Tax=Alteribacter aurantiacus TaxID=254410 RepID=UPI00047B10F5|nr:ribonuclease HII [Alteribacter aurantiacus]